MAKVKKVEETIGLTRRAFLKYAGAGLVVPTVIGMVPEALSGKLSWRAYAQSEAALPDELRNVALKYGEPQGKFGKIGDPVTLTIGYQPYGTAYWTSTVNKQAQIWAKYLPAGSKVVWFRALSGPLINKNMTEGKNQFGYMAETPGLRSGDSVDCDMVCVTGYDLGESGAISVRNDLLTDGKVKKPKDLESLPFATPRGSRAHRQCISWADENGLNPSFLDQSVEAQVSHLRDKTLAVAGVWEPYPTFLEQQGLATRWITGLEMPCSCKKYYPEAANHSFCVVGSTLAIFDWLRDRPDIMLAYLKSEEECRDMLTNDPDLAAYHIWSDIAGHYIWSDITEAHPAVIRVTLDMMVWDGRITEDARKHLKGVARMWRDKKFLTSKRSENPDQFVDSWADDRILRVAINELKAQGQWTSDRLPGFPKPVRPDQTGKHTWKTYENIELKEKPWKATKV